MKLAIVGASGRVGRHLVREALHRGYQVTAMARHFASLPPEPALTFRRADVHVAAELQEAIQGHAALISAVGPAAGEAASVIVDATRALAAACMRTGTRRVLVVGGAGTLEVEPGCELLRSAGFPPEQRELALAHREALELWRKVKELDWTVLSPAATLAPGTRTGSYRTGHNDLLRGADGQSRISLEDLAVAVVDEVERGAHLRERITVAY